MSKAARDRKKARRFFRRVSFAALDVLMSNHRIEIGRFTDQDGVLKQIGEFSVNPEYATRRRGESKCL